MADSELQLNLAFEPKWAHRLARRLKTIKGFPWDPEDIDATADDLQRWCRNEEEAEGLINLARDSWTTWKGTAALRELYLAKYKPGPEALSRDFGERPVITCKACSDEGWYLLPSMKDPLDSKTTGPFVDWCTCSAAAELREQDPKYVEFRNDYERRFLRSGNRCWSPPHISQLRFVKNRVASPARARRSVKRKK